VTAAIHGSVARWRSGTVSTRITSRASALATVCLVLIRGSAVPAAVNCCVAWWRGITALARPTARAVAQATICRILILCGMTVAVHV
jgi:hypothetical protein